MQTTAIYDVNVSKYSHTFTTLRHLRDDSFYYLETNQLICLGRSYENGILRRIYHI